MGSMAFRSLAAALVVAGTVAAAGGAAPSASVRPLVRGDDLLERRSLSCGVPLAVLPVADAPLETFFALLPLGMAHDDAGRTQWGHLLEHMLIRTTDAEGLADGDISFNGETGDATLRLDVHAPPALAPQAAAKLSRWLAAESFDPAVLEREKGKVLAEFETTVPAGYTHKWATAAWAQAVRHGADDVALRGDVQAATVEALAEYWAQKRARAPGLALYASGPLPTAKVAELFEEPGASAAAPGSESAGAPAKTEAAAGAGAAAKEWRRGEVTARWDLARPHLIEWYLVPDGDAAARVTTLLLVQTLTQTLMSDPKLQQARIIALVSADATFPEGRLVQFSASLPDAGAAATARAAFARARERLTSAPPAGSLDRWLQQVRAELSSGLPDFRRLRGQWAGRQQQQFVEAQLLLALALRERSSGLSLAAMAATAEQLTGGAVKKFRDEQLAAERANVLLLLPRE